MRLFRTTPNFNFIRWRWHALALSTVIIMAGAALVVTRGLPLGIDFAGGTAIVVKFERPVTEQAILEALASQPGEKMVQRYGAPGDNEILIRLPELVVEQGASLEQGARAVFDRLKQANLGNFVEQSTEIVGPAVGADLQRKGIYATLFSLAAITAYIAIRFRVSFALGSIVATFHDILATLAFLVFFEYELSLNIVAAMLTMVGYSVNDMIVIFDRVRENSRLARREPLEKVINDSINQTLTRTVITSGTIFLSVLALYVFGGEVLEGFAFTMLVGTVATTYSGWFIAPSIAIMLSKPSASVRAAAAAATGGQRPNKKRA
ncbi:MAG: protein translocase subunit SecF [Vicinamibacterales bacterium]